VPCAAEHRMVGDTVLDAELAEPTIGKIHLHFGADTPRAFGTPQFIAAG
jgi:hypothetical protein